MFEQIINAVNELHINGFCHRDIKSENILFDKKNKIKISDLGFASSEVGLEFSDGKGTPNYMAPEIFEKKTYKGTYADIFAAGVVLY